MTLDLLRADIEQADGGLQRAQHGAGEDISHDRELHQILGVAAEIGAEVEHHALAAQGREEGGDRRAVDARQGPQHEFGDGHQRAGIAGGDDARRLARLHRVDGQAHARAATGAQRRRGLVVGGDDPVGVANLARLAQRPVAVEQRRYPPLIAEEEEAHIRESLARDIRAFDDHVGGPIAPHRVECNAKAGRLHRIWPPREGTDTTGLCSRRRGRNLPTVVVAAGGADVMRPLQLATIRAFDGFDGRQTMVRAPHVATGLRHLLLWNRHDVSLP